MNDEAIAQLEERLRQAMLCSDVAALDELIADDLLFTGPTGELFSKQIDLELHRSGAQTLRKIELLERHIKTVGEVAIVNLKAELAGTFQDEDFAGIYRYTRIWSQLQGRWQIVAGHVSQVFA